MQTDIEIDQDSLSLKNTNYREGSYIIVANKNRVYAVSYVSGINITDYKSHQAYMNNPISGTSLFTNLSKAMFYAKFMDSIYKSDLGILYSEEFLFEKI